MSAFPVSYESEQKGFIKDVYGDFTENIFHKDQVRLGQVRVETDIFHKGQQDLLYSDNDNVFK